MAPRAPARPSAGGRGCPSVALRERLESFGLRAVFGLVFVQLVAADDEVAEDADEREDEDQQDPRALAQLERSWLRKMSKTTVMATQIHRIRTAISRIESSASPKVNVASTISTLDSTAYGWQG